MHEMNTCAVRGVLSTGGMCGKVIVGGKLCGHVGECVHKRIEMCEASDEILPVDRVTRDGGDYTVKCPHCGRLIGLEGDDLSQIRGEQFQHRQCGGWLEVRNSARFVQVL
jgi:hypothetical protein